MQKRMRTGYTTGSCAAAGAKAALLALMGERASRVEIASPQGEKMSVPIHLLELTRVGARAVVVKDAGDDPDITNGVEIVVEARIRPDSPEISIRAGKGVGTVTKPGLSVKKGQPAINPGPMAMIRLAARDALKPGQGCEITVSIPEGERLAKRTLNPSLGIVGGLSVIGTTGIVRPMSEEAFKNSLSPQIRVAKAQGYKTVVFVPGKIGETAAVKCGLPRDAIVQTSNFIGYMLETAADEEIKQALLFGHLGKLAKVAAGIFHTHNRVADARLETLAAYLAYLGAPQAAIKEIFSCVTTEAALPVIEKYRLRAAYPLLAARASARARRYVFDQFDVGTVLVTLSGEILGMDETARRIGEELAWNIKSS